MNKTGMGAATGAVVGGGLGLIVGSTSGNAGEGLLVGSIAGGAIGAGVGAKLQRDEEKKSADTGRENIFQQDETIKQQDEEIQNLRKNNTDEAKNFYSSDIDVTKPSARMPSSNPVVTPDLSKAELVKPESIKPELVKPQPAKTTSRARLSSSGGIEYLSRPSGIKKGSPFDGRSAADPIVVAKAAPAPAAVRTTTTTRVAPKAEPKMEVKFEPKPEPKSEAKIEHKAAPAAAVADTKNFPSKMDDSFAMNDAPILSKKSAPAAAESSAKALSSGLPPAAIAGAEALAKNSSGSPKGAHELGNCKDAVKEAEHGLNASSDADRLFYLRRAARLCPTEPTYHVELGKLYGAIGKSDDAKYELRQAVDLDPNNQVARDELSIIENAGTVTR